MYRVSGARAARGRWRVAAFALLCAASPAAAATDAGTRIVNVAGLRYGADGHTAQVSSNAVTLTVAELLDVATATPSPVIAVARSEADVPVAFTVTNLGNAAETFAVAAHTDRPAATIAGIAVDENDDGVYDPAVDRALPDAGLALAVGQGRRLFVLVRGAAATDEPTLVTAAATASTGHGEPGSSFPGAGADGADAIVGHTGATAAASARIVPGAGAPTLTKSQSVVAPDGSDRVVAGSRVTYRLDARFFGPAAAVEIVDAIPAGTRYVAGSMTVDGQAASDAADGDAAAFDGDAVRVALGDIAAASARSIQFTVQIQ